MLFASETPVRIGFKSWGVFKLMEASKIASMTAFARHAAHGDWGHATWEIRSVNHRYLDLGFKIPDTFREWEQSWRHIASKILDRGKVDCLLTYLPSEQTAAHYKLNENLVEQLVFNGRVVARHSSVTENFSAFEILQWPGVLQAVQKDITFIKSHLTELFEKTLNTLEIVRLREGEAIGKFLFKKLNKVSTHVQAVRKLLPDCREALKQKIMQRVDELELTIDPQRLEQELVLYVQRIDVEEEMERLETHVKEAIRVIEQEEPAGRRLDFLMQEMGREANTLASKSQNTAITQEAIELKLLIEQMREQIQNVE